MIYAHSAMQLSSKNSYFMVIHMVIELGNACKGIQLIFNKW